MKLFICAIVLFVQADVFSEATIHKPITEGNMKLPINLMKKMMPQPGSPKGDEGKPEDIPPPINQNYRERHGKPVYKIQSKRDEGKPEDIPPTDYKDKKIQKNTTIAKRNQPHKDQYSIHDLHKEWEIQSSILKERRNLEYPEREGPSSESQSCSDVRAVPDDLRQAMKIDQYYQQYTETYGIPVMAPSSVQPDALRRLCYVANVMFADNKQLRDNYYQMGGFFVAWKSSYKEVPAWSQYEFSFGIAGLGPTTSVPATGLGEVDILCTEESSFRPDREDVSIHEVAHTMGLTLFETKAYDNWAQRMEEAYNKAMNKGLWKDMYAATNHHEYFAEGVERYFDAGAKGQTPEDKEQLKSYDPEFYALIEEVFPCNNKIINLCEQNRDAEQEEIQSLSRNCAVQAPPVEDLPPGPECRQTELGTEYHGTTAVSGAGNECQKWFENKAWVSFPPGEIDHKNYCRNPDKDPKGPWCYLVDQTIAQYQYCNIPLCSSESDCRDTLLGNEYRGTTAVTKSGTPCINWNDYPGPYFPSGETDHKNYCRNPDKDSKGPWCFTSDYEWAYCDIPLCSDSNCRDTQLGTGYNGVTAVTTLGIPCVNWDGYSGNNNFPPGETDHKNYCRNPDSDPNGPWCFISEDRYQWGYCSIPLCSANT